MPGVVRGMPKEDEIEAEGSVIELLPNALFQVVLESGNPVLCHASGRIRQNKIRIAVGDRVAVTMSKYDLSKGRITYRHK